MDLHYDLHCHSCLSPCADNDMTPVFVAGMAELTGSEMLSLTDHNSALNLPAAAAACHVYGVVFLPGIEVTTAEEIHILSYFPTVEAAQKMGALLYESLPDIPCDEQVFGCQLAMNEEDEEISRPKKLLINATGLDIYDTVRETQKLGGRCVPAHLDKATTSLLSVLGFMPEDISFPCIELRNLASAEQLISSGRMPTPSEILTSSDAHCISEIGSANGLMHNVEDSYLWPVLRRM